MKIRNINGTSDKTCECGSWIDHWKKFSGQSLPAFCPTVGCYNKSLVGAHVQKDSYSDNKWYIVPLCSTCNGKKGESLDISDTYNLVSANVSETCGK